MLARFNWGSNTAVTMETSSLPSAPSVILITGIMAAGKSTVAQELAEQLPKSVHLRGDVFRRMIVRGRAEMDFELSPDAYEQLRLRYRIASTVADQYVRAGFTVVYQDIIIGQELAEAVRYYQQHALYIVVLCPAPHAVAAREAARSKTGYRDIATVDAFDRVLRQDTPRVGLWLDTSNLTVEETVVHILTNLAQAKVPR